MRLLPMIMVFMTCWCCPAMAQDTTNIETVEAAQEELQIITDTQVVTRVMYSKGEFEIKQEPDDCSIVLGISMKNTEFEVIGEIENWSVITTEDGLAYIKTENLSETPLPEYTEKDLDILAHVICGEAQGYSDVEQRYVGSVVLNRVKDHRFPDSIESVVFQKGQYACTRDGNYYREPTEQNWANAKWLLENGSVLPDNVVWQSGRKQGKGVYLKTKRHYYCY